MPNYQPVASGDLSNKVALIGKASSPKISFAIAKSF